MNSSEFISIFKNGQQNMAKWKPFANNKETSIANVLDFFCCAGGMTLGFASLPNYFHVLGGIDINSTSLEAYKKNYSTPTLNIDITSIEPKSAIIANTFGLSGNKKKPLVIIGCAPCQGFSPHRKKDYRKPEDKRNTLIGYFADMAVHLDPDFVVMENVPEILNGKFKNHYNEAKEVFTAHGYHIAQHIYNAAGFGVPQARYRAIIVASKYESFRLPEEILTPDNYATVRDAIGDLPPVDVRNQHPNDCYHKCSAHRQSTIDVIAQVPHDGGSRPKGVGPQCLDKVKGFSDVYGRLSWDKPSITITQYARNPASGRYSHPEQDRGLTIREAARLQSFPDGYEWNGSLGDNFKQIGEAVPPLLSLAIASQIAITLKCNSKR